MYVYAFVLNICGAIIAIHIRFVLVGISCFSTFFSLSAFFFAINKNTNDTQTKLNTENQVAEQRH